MAHSVNGGEEATSIEITILADIKESEKKADGILEKAKAEKEKILLEARLGSSKLVSAKSEEIMKLQEKKLMDFRDKSKLIIEEKIAEGKISSKQVKSKSEKNIQKAAEFVVKKFEEMV